MPITSIYDIGGTKCGGSQGPSILTNDIQKTLKCLCPQTDLSKQADCLIILQSQFQELDAYLDNAIKTWNPVANANSPLSNYTDQSSVVKKIIPLIANNISEIQNPDVATAESIVKAAKQKRIWFAVFGILGIIAAVIGIIWLRRKARKEKS